MPLRIALGQRTYTADLGYDFNTAILKLLTDDNPTAFILQTNPTNINMKASFAIATAVSVLAGTAAAAAIDKRATSTSAVDAAAVRDAVLNWQQDTATVSQFLDEAAAQIIIANNGGTIDLTGDAFNAFGSESDELNQKGTLEAQLCFDSTCQQNLGVSDIGTSIGAAKAELENGSFNSVLFQLLQLTDSSIGADINNGAIGPVNIINLGNATTDGRCAGVLFAIDIYFETASNVLQQIDPTDNSLVGIKAVRPQACNGISALQGF
ncbi:hypothetical protein LTR22_020512 [Elasticomyces elasticus]|nr:hypothetical protein LTR22_020512 [Elasticomyces elasticus]